MMTCLLISPVVYITICEGEFPFRLPGIRTCTIFLLPVPQCLLSDRSISLQQMETYKETQQDIIERSTDCGEPNSSETSTS